jgi:hypothetical protein
LTLVLVAEIGEGGLEMGNDKWVDVSVTWSEEGVKVDPDEVQLYYDAEPNEVRWKITGGRPSGTKVSIMWASDSAFDQVGPPAGSDGELHGTKIRRRQGKYKYAVLFVDKDGQVKAGIDPSIFVDPLP